MSAPGSPMSAGPCAASLAPPTVASVLLHLRSAWASLRPQEAAAFLLLGLALGLTRLGQMLELPPEAPWPQALSRELLEPVLAALLLLPCWLPAQRSAPEHPQRWARLALAALLGAALASLLLAGLVRGLDWPSVGDLHRLSKGLPLHPALSWQELLSKLLSLFIPALLGFVLIELLARRRQASARLQRLLVAQSQLSREALAARLAALQAQVEPEFLFENLQEIEQAYALDAQTAGARLERLIQHLRMALPRLRADSAMGSRLAQEAELLASYMAVCQDRSGQALSLRRDWPPTLDTAALPPMLLLPLLQGVLRRLGPADLCVTLQAQAGAAGALHLRLQLNRPGLCGSADELQTLRERATSLCGPGARVACHSRAGQTCFELELPA